MTTLKNWSTEVEAKLKRGNKILFEKNGSFLDELNQLILQCTHRTLVLWSLELAKEVSIKLALKYPNEASISDCHTSATLWAIGEMKMAKAKKEILNCHAFAKTISDQGDIALVHALGQGCSVVHTPKHALGLPLYQLTSIVLINGLTLCEQQVLNQRQYYIDRLHFWNNQPMPEDQQWAPFIK